MEENIYIPTPAFATAYGTAYNDLDVDDWLSKVAEKVKQLNKTRKTKKKYKVYSFDYLVVWLEKHFKKKSGKDFDYKLATLRNV